MRSQVKKGLIVLMIVLLASTAGKSQTTTAYTKYVNTFVGTAPLTDSAILGYNLPKG